MKLENIKKLSLNLGALALLMIISGCGMGLLPFGENNKKEGGGGDVASEDAAEEVQDLSLACGESAIDNKAEILKVIEIGTYISRVNDAIGPGMISPEAAAEYSRNFPKPGDTYGSLTADQFFSARPNLQIDAAMLAVEATSNYLLSGRAASGKWAAKSDADAQRIISALAPYRNTCSPEDDEIVAEFASLMRDDLGQALRAALGSLLALATQ